MDFKIERKDKKHTTHTSIKGRGTAAGNYMILKVRENLILLGWGKALKGVSKIMRVVPEMKLEGENVGS